MSKIGGVLLMLLGLLVFTSLLGFCNGLEAANHGLNFWIEFFRGTLIWTLIILVLSVICGVAGAIVSWGFSMFMGDKL